MGKYITAVDFGTAKMTVAVGEKSATGVRITAFAEAKSKGINRGEVLNIKAVRDTLTSLVKDIEEQMLDIDAEFKVKTLYSGFSGTNIRCGKVTVERHRTDERRTIEQHEIEGMLAEAYKSFKNDGEVVLHVIPQSYNIDDQRGLSDIEGHQGKHVMGFYLLFIGKTKYAEHTSSVISKAGYDVGKLVLSPLASAASILTDEEMELGTALVDIGAGTTDLLICKDDRIRYGAVIPFGGDSITQDIRQVCNVTERHAEVMKRKHGSCLSSLASDNKFIGITDEKGNICKRVPVRQLIETIEARTEEIIAAVKNEIILSGMERKINKIVLTGGGSNLNQLSILFRQLTGYSVRQAIPYDRKILTNSCPKIFNFTASTVAGLVLKGFEYESAKEVEEKHPQQLPDESEETSDPKEEPTVVKQKKTGLFHIFNHSQKDSGKKNADKKPAATPDPGPGKPAKKDGSLFDGFFNDGNDDEA